MGSEELPPPLQGEFLSWLDSRAEEEHELLQLPFTGLALLHVQNHKIYGVEEAIEHDVEENANFAWSHAFGHKGIHDVNSIADFWSWLRLGLVPLVLQTEYAYSESQ